MLLIYLTLADTDSDKEKMTIIYNRYEGLVYSIAYSFLNNQQDAEDAKHDAFLKIVKNINAIEDVQSHKTKAFIVIIIENVCKDILKKKNKINSTSYELIEYEFVSPNNVEEDVIRTSSIEQLYEKIKELELIHQHALILRYSKNLSYDEMSDILHISKVAARKRVQRARDILSLKLTNINYIER